jgi:hypothetical protein
VLNSVADQLMAQFAGNLQTILDAPEGVGAAASEGADAGVSGGAHAAPEEAETPGAVQVRSDTTVVEAVEDVADGTGVPAPPEQVTRGGASVGQVGGDEAITEAAQSAPSGRVADRISASDPRPSPDTYRGKHVDSAEDDSFDALAFARGVLATQVRQPRVLAGLVALAMLVAYLLGRASGRRHGA